MNTEWDPSFFRGITQYCEAAGDRVNQRATAVGADLSAAQFHVEVSSGATTGTAKELVPG